MRTEFATAADFWEGMVEPDLAECERHPGDLRAAFHAASSLFHMADWTYQTHKAAVHAAFGISPSIKDKEGTIAFANALVTRCPEFAHIREIANAGKHLRLLKTARGATETFVRMIPATGGYGVGEIAYGRAGAYGGGPKVMFAERNGGDLSFLQIARSVANMWRRLRTDYGW
jgi:hypothetical protein